MLAGDAQDPAGRDGHRRGQRRGLHGQRHGQGRLRQRADRERHRLHHRRRPRCRRADSRAARAAPSPPDPVRHSAGPGLSIRPGPMWHHRPMPNSDRAGLPADPSILVDLDRLIGAYHDVVPDPADPTQRVAFGTSGHRGSSFNGAFNEAHIVSMTRPSASTGARRARMDRCSSGATRMRCPSRRSRRPSRSSWRTAWTSASTPPMATRRRPVVSHAILAYNRGRREHLADGIVVTPSHNPPEDGGFKYDPPNGGPADSGITGWIQDRSNELLAGGWKTVERTPYRDARAAATNHDYLSSYVADLDSVVDMAAIAGSGLRLGVDPLGGASVAYWPAIGERYGLDLAVTNDVVDPRFAFMTCDWDGRIRMDPSSPYAMARPGGAEEPVRSRLRQRRRCRSPRDRDARRGPHEPEPLPVGGRDLPVRRGP